MKQNFTIFYLKCLSKEDICQKGQRDKTKVKSNDGSKFTMTDYLPVRYSKIGKITFSVTGKFNKLTNKYMDLNEICLKNIIFLLWLSLN